MLQIFIANVKFFDHCSDETITHTIVVQAGTYGEAVVAIEKAYGENIPIWQRLELMCRTEELAFAELASFLRSANNSKYIF